jgi:UDP-3-O-[3-hydroxymyristoyl] N-acetylglucosamine deacetylase
VRRLSSRQQRALARSTEVPGVGLVTGAKVRLRFCPAPPDTGIAFLRTDMPGAVSIPARPERVTGTQRRTTLGSGPNQVTLVEHVLAALGGMRIDNCVVEMDGPEPPGLDGSARGFVEALLKGGLVSQDARRAVWTVDEPMIIRHDGATLSLHPAAGMGLRISYLLDYGLCSPIAPQAHTEAITPERFRNELADCRTFMLEAEADELQRQGVGRHLKPAQILVFGRRGPIDNRLRCPNEPARHKVLDLVGDLALCGFDLAGHLVAYRSGHPLNVELARTLAQAVRATAPAAAPVAA